MKYYILEGNMKPDIPQGPEFKKILDAHHDHLMGIIWMVRMICQFMNHGEYKGEAYIYSHKWEETDLLRG